MITQWVVFLLCWWGAPQIKYLIDYDHTDLILLLRFSIIVHVGKNVKVAAAAVR